MNTTCVGVGIPSAGGTLTVAVVPTTPIKLPGPMMCTPMRADPGVGASVIVTIPAVTASMVKKNGIMMIDFALDAQRNEGKSPADAIYEACVIRFRPIMMTTMAALMGTLPIAIGLGAGAESRRPLGLAVVGGLLFSQLLTLFVTPVFYLYMDRFMTATQRILRREPALAGQ